jgi:hypothetical protein
VVLPFGLRQRVVGVVDVFRRVPVGIRHRFDVAIAVIGVFCFVFQRVRDRESATLGVSFDFGCVFRGFAADDVSARANRGCLLRVGVVFPRPLVAFRSGFAYAVAVRVVFVFGGPFQRIGRAFHFAVRGVFVFRDLGFRARCGTGHLDRVAMRVSFDGRRLAGRVRRGFDIVRGVVGPFRFVAVWIEDARAVAGTVVSILGGVPVGVGFAGDISVFVVRIRFRRCCGSPVASSYRRQLAGAGEVLVGDARGGSVGDLGVKRFVFECDGVFRRVLLRCHLVGAVVFVDRFSAASVGHRGQLVRAVVFELPAECRFGGLGDRRQVAFEVGVFDDVTHRVLGAFDKTFGVVRQSDFASARVGDRFQSAAFAVAEGCCVAVSVGDAFKAPAASGELVFDLVGQRHRVTGGGVPSQRVRRPRRRRESAFARFPERHGAGAGLMQGGGFACFFHHEAIAEGGCPAVPEGPMFPRRSCL